MSGGGLPGPLRSRLQSLVSQAEAETRKYSPRQLLKAEKKRPKHRRPTKPKTREQAFADLDIFIEEAKAGLEDEHLARQAGVTLTAVLAWRKQRGIRHVRGHVRRRQLQAQALDMFGTGYDPLLHAVDSSLRGSWEIPEYVLRRPLLYSETCRLLHFLYTAQGASTDTLARAFGLRRRDVETAIAVETAHLTEISALCVSCGRPIDPAYGNTCSLICKEKT